MSAIGDYIHLTRMGYENPGEYGYKKDASLLSYKNLEAVYKGRKKIFNQEIQKRTSKDINRIEKELRPVIETLNEIRAGNMKNISPETMEKIEDSLKEVEEQYNKDFMGVDLGEAVENGLFGKAGLKAGTNFGVKENYDKKTKTQQQVITNVREKIYEYLTSSFNQIIDIATLVDNQGFSKNKLIKQLKRKKSNLKKELDKAKMVSVKVANQNKRKNKNEYVGKIYLPKSIDKLIQKLLADDEIKGNQSIVKILEEIEQGIQSLENGMTIQQYKGNLSEAFITSYLNAILPVIYKNINSTLRVGQNQNKRGFNSSVLNENLKLNLIYEGAGKNDRLYVKSNSVYGKADLKIIHEQDQGTSTLSLKNYASGSAKKTTNSSNDFFILMQNENADFMNHYITLNAARGKGKASDYGANRAKVNDLVRRIVIAKLLAAVNLTTGEKTIEPVDIFLMIEDTGTKFVLHIFTMKDLLNRIFKSGKYKNQKTRIPEFFFEENVKQEPMTEYPVIRISNLLKTLAVETSHTFDIHNYQKG